jgi:hypothetical protein
MNNLWTFLCSVLDCFDLFWVENCSGIFQVQNWMFDGSLAIETSLESSSNFSRKSTEKIDENRQGLNPVSINVSLISSINRSLNFQIEVSVTSLVMLACPQPLIL